MNVFTSEIRAELRENVYICWGEPLIYIVCVGGLISRCSVTYAVGVEARTHVPASVYNIIEMTMTASHTILLCIV